MSKSLKDYFTQIEKQKLDEAVPQGMKPMAILDPANKEAGVGVLSSSNPAIQKMLGGLDPKDVKIVMTKSAAPSSTSGTTSAQTGLSTGGGATAMREADVMEKAPPGMEDMVLKLKKQYPGHPEKAFATAWSIYNKKHGKDSVEEGIIDSAMKAVTSSASNIKMPDIKSTISGAVGKVSQTATAADASMKSGASSIKSDAVNEAEKWIQKAIKKPGALKKQLGVPADEPIPAGKLAAAAKKGGKLGQRARLAQTLKKMHEGDIPHAGPDYGAGIGAGRSATTLESKKVTESMNTLEAAYHEGKSHGLSKHGYACRYNEGTDEHRRYHEGFKEGLDECYGLQPNRGLVVGETVPATVHGMADQVEAGLDEMDKTAYMKQQAIKTPGDTFKAFGQTMHDKDVLEADAFAFESLDQKLNALLNEDAELVTEGVNVSMSQGQGGMHGDKLDDSVSVSATGDDAAKLLAFIKQVGIGGLGGSEASDAEVHTDAHPVSVTSDYGAPKFAGHDDMKSLISKVTGDEEDSEEGSEDEEGVEEAHACNECGMMETECGCDKEVVDEVETPDQETDEMAEDAAGEAEEQETTADEDAEAEEDSTKPASGGATNESVNLEKGKNIANTREVRKLMSDAFGLKDPIHNNARLANEPNVVYLTFSAPENNADEMKDQVIKALADAGYTNKVSATGEGRYINIRTVRSPKPASGGATSASMQLDEWANEAGKDGTEAAFERDIEFMTKVIAGGLNKPKSTGQTTIPVIAHQDARTGDEDVTAWKKLAGLGK